MRRRRELIWMRRRRSPWKLVIMLDKVMVRRGKKFQ